MHNKNFDFRWKIFIWINFILLLFLIVLILLGNLDIDIKPWQNGWSGFAGGIAGGILTLVGVIITINYYKNSDFKNYQRTKLLNKPLLKANVYDEKTYSLDADLSNIVEKTLECPWNTNATRKIILKVENASNGIAKNITFQHYIYQDYKKIDFDDYIKKLNVEEAPVVQRYLKNGDCFYIVLNFRFNNGKDFSGTFKIEFCDYEGEKIHEPIVLLLEYLSNDKMWKTVMHYL